VLSVLFVHRESSLLTAPRDVLLNGPVADVNRSYQLLDDTVAEAGLPTLSPIIGEGYPGCW